MKMMMLNKQVMWAMGFSLVTVLSQVSLAQAQSTSSARVAELSLHRVERLVILKKIEEAFQSQMKDLKLELIAHQVPGDASYKSTISLFPGADGSQKRIEIIMNEEGKTLQHTVIQGAAAISTPVWPDKDSVTLCENALHFVQDQAVKPEIAPFNQSFSTLSITEGKSSNGSQIAIVSIHSSTTGNVLNVKLKTDGTLESTEVVIAPSATPVVPEVPEVPVMPDSLK